MARLRPVAGRTATRPPRNGSSAPGRLSAQSRPSTGCPWRTSSPPPSSGASPGRHRSRTRRRWPPRCVRAEPGSGRSPWPRNRSQLRSPPRSTSRPTCRPAHRSRTRPPMAAEPGATADHRVTLLAVPAHLSEAALAGDLDVLTPDQPGSLHRGRGWPHDDSAHALAFTGVGGQTYLVVDETGAVVGEVGTKGPAAADGHVEIGYGLAAASRGQGVGTVAVRVLVDLLRDQPGVLSVEAN